MKTSHGKLALLAFVLLMAALLFLPMRAGMEDQLLLQPARLKMNPGDSYTIRCALSSDEGVTWTEMQHLEDGSEDAGYCYTAILPMEDAVLLAYCAGNREDGSCLNRLRVRKVSLRDLT